MIKELKVTPLGTVSPYCKLDKNGPGFMIENGDNKILLDCGSGVTRLMNMETDLKNLIIIISHLHKDHYADLLPLSYASYVYHNMGFLDNRIKVYIPNGDKMETIEEYMGDDRYAYKRKVQKELIDYSLFKYLGEENYLEIIDYNDETSICLNDMQISFYKTKHNINTFASCIKVGDKKICYSADTGYDENIISFIKNADLFICESTFLREQNKMGNNHLFAHEAGILSKGANVKQLMLTHFWPEIDKTLYLKEAKEIFKNTIVAEEGKQLILGG